MFSWLFSLCLCTSVYSQLIKSGLLSVDIVGDSYTLNVGTLTLKSAPLSVFLSGQYHNKENGTLLCNPLAPTSGTDKFGLYKGISLTCKTQKENIPVVYSIRGYEESSQETGRLVFEVSLPLGGSGCQIQKPPPPGTYNGDNAPPQFAPFPAFLLQGSFENSGGFLCYSTDKCHANAGGPGLTKMPSNCPGIVGGPTIFYWPKKKVISPPPSEDGLVSLITSAADSFKLNYHRIDKETGIWSWGVSGEILSVPPEFTQSVILVVSADGVNRAVDEWGAVLRRAYNTSRKADEDIFLTAVSVWTDNGASTEGMDWPSSVTPPSGGYRQINWNAVDGDVLTNVVQSVQEAGVMPRGFQWDCWWYPISTGDFLCATNWSLPEQYYKGGLGGMRQSLGIPFMLYLPAVCPGTSQWNGKYEFQPVGANYKLPSARDSLRFFTDLFQFGKQVSTPQDRDSLSDPWRGVWVPPAVRKGWQGVTMAAYEIDFWNVEFAGWPELRSNFMSGEQFLKGLNDAGAAESITVQVCAAIANDLLTSLTMPWITQARGSIDYAWSIGDPGISGDHNWAPHDSAFVFWATKVANSKDNFWSSYVNLAPSGYTPDSPYVGFDSELHTLGSILSTGPVGLGDYQKMTNGTLIGRTCRKDGVLLKPDRPLGPMDVLLGGYAGSRGLPTDGPRSWMTHATVAPEDSGAPELMVHPTRRIVSHRGVDATRIDTVPEALRQLNQQVDASPSSLFQWLVMSVDVNNTFPIYASDLYPLPSELTGVTSGPIDTLLVREWHWPACNNNSDPVKSNCLKLISYSNTSQIPLFDIHTDQSGVTCLHCAHKLTYWQIHPVSSKDKIVVLGDLSKYVSLSGYRFRLAGSSPISLVVVGTPNEEVDITYLVNSDMWTSHVMQVVIPSTGRIVVTLTN